ncbi:MAG: MBL fold metallo-hydrolase [Lachnospiraceae bacterium]|nr:MBL fold metallo-hydrolase [Lachnospiraceae bacterium]
MDILKYCSDFYEQTEEIECRHGARLLIIRDAVDKDFDNMKNLLEEQGYSCYATRQEGEVPFATYQNSDEILNLSYIPFEKTVRIIQDTGSVLPPGERRCCSGKSAPDAGERVHEPSDGETAYGSGNGTHCGVAPLVTQVHQRYWEHDCGMTYLIRLGDGRFAIIDGGMAEAGETEHLLALLKEQNVREGVPQIAVWFFTHAHIDHFNGFVKMMQQYKKEVYVESLVYSWVREDLAKGFSPLTEFEETLSNLLKSENPPKLIRPRTGQQFVYADVVFDVLFTCEDLYPQPIPNLNNSSLVLRMTACGRRVFWAADMQDQTAGYLAKKYPKDSFKSEILQVGHHGYWGTSEELNEMIDPEILFWPCPGFRYPDLLEWEGNQFLANSPNIRRVFVSGLEETTLDMTKPILPSPVYAAKDGVIYETDFEGADAWNVFWGCIRGRSQVHYKSYDISFPKEGGCRLSAGEDYCVCEWANALRMEGHPDFKLTFTGCAEAGCEKAALFWNDPTPRVWEEERALRIPMQEGEFKVELIADSKAKKAQLYYNGALAKEMEYVLAKRRSICYIMRKAAVVLKSIRITEL